MTHSWSSFNIELTWAKMSLACLTTPSPSLTSYFSDFIPTSLSLDNSAPATLAGLLNSSSNIPSPLLSLAGIYCLTHILHLQGSPSLTEFMSLLKELFNKETFPGQIIKSSTPSHSSSLTQTFSTMVPWEY